MNIVERLVGKFIKIGVPIRTLRTAFEIIQPYKSSYFVINAYRIFRALDFLEVQFSKHFLNALVGLILKPNHNIAYFWASWILSLLLTGKSLFLALLCLLDLSLSISALEESLRAKVPNCRFRESINIVIKSDFDLRPLMIHNSVKSLHCTYRALENL